MKKHFLLLPLFLCCCGDDPQLKNIGETCSSDTECVSGLICDNDTKKCQTGCSSANDCKEGQDCNDGRCKDCPTGFSGQNCAECLPGRFGENCIDCLCLHGDCNDGRQGDGHCKTNSCEIGTQGDNDCQECADGFSDNDCSACQEGARGFMYDENHNKYKATCIDGKIWMGENMRKKTGAYLHVNDDPTHDETYGYLYDLPTALSICPKGWRLPSVDDYLQLQTYLGNGHEQFLSLIASSTDWIEYSNEGKDLYGFSGLPAGKFLNGEYSQFGLVGYYWTSTLEDWDNNPEEHSEQAVELLSLGFNHLNVDQFDKNGSYSVRCIKGASN